MVSVGSSPRDAGHGGLGPWRLDVPLKVLQVDAEQTTVTYCARGAPRARHHLSADLWRTSPVIDRFTDALTVP